MRYLLDDQVSITSTVDSGPNTEELSAREEQAQKIGINNRPLQTSKLDTRGNSLSEYRVERFLLGSHLFISSLPSIPKPRHQRPPLPTCRPATRKTHSILPLERTDKPPQHPLGPLSLILSPSDISEQLGPFSPVSWEFSERGGGEDEGGCGHAR